MTDAIRLVPRGPFSLAAAAAFVDGWPPAGRADGDPLPDDGTLRLALGPDGACGPLGVTMRQSDAELRVDAAGPGTPEAVAARVARVLSLDVDGRGYRGAGRRDPVVRAALRRMDDLRPVLFPSPFEAGVWAILSQRTRMTQALRTRARIVAEHGTTVEAGGVGMAAFPAPEALHDLPPGPGITLERAERLRELAGAASDGFLDADRLRDLPADEALRELRELPGVGPFSAQLILIRGAGAPDVLPLAEPRLREAVASAYGLDAPPSDAELERIAEAWRPYRSWVALLLRAAHGRGAGVSPPAPPRGGS